MLPPFKLPDSVCGPPLRCQKRRVRVTTVVLSHTLTAQRDLCQETCAKGAAAHHSHGICLEEQEVQGHVPEKDNVTRASALALLHDLAVRIKTWNGY